MKGWRKEGGAEEEREAKEKEVKESADMKKEKES